MCSLDLSQESGTIFFCVFEGIYGTCRGPELFMIVCYNNYYDRHAMHTECWSTEFTQCFTLKCP